MSSLAEKSTRKRGRVEDNKPTADVHTHPFVCGICSEKFDNLHTFMHHFTSHRTISNNNENMHICKCLYAEGVKEGSETNTDVDVYKCRICKYKFPSICSLHNHILQCSLDGSYIYDHTHKMVYPLSLSCLNFEHRDQNKCDRLDEDLVDVSALNNEDMSTAEKVDLVLQKVFKIFGKNIHEKNKIQNKKGRRKPKIQNKSSEVLCKDEAIIEVKNEANEGEEMPNTCNAKKGKRKRKLAKKSNDVVHKDEMNLNVKSELSDKETMEFENKKIDVFKVENEITDCEKVTKEQDHLEYEIVKVEPELLGDFNQSAVNYATNSNETIGNVDSHVENANTNNTNCSDKLKVKSKRKSKSKNLKSLKPMKEQRQTPKKNMTVNGSCPECGKTMPTPSKLNHHMKMHSDERPFKCDKCPKTYKYKNHLEEHAFSHSDSKPFCCDKCGKGFVSSTMLRYHDMTHHGEAKPCVCTKCGAGFVSKFKLKRHMMKHTGEKSEICEICGKGFVTKYNLKEHIQNIHKKSRRFTCDICGRDFMTNYQLKIHGRRHSGERPFKCVLCKVEYSERKELRMHIRKRHQQLIKENDNALSELMEGSIAGISKVETEGTRATQQSQKRVPEQGEVNTAAESLPGNLGTVYSAAESEFNQTDSFPSVKFALGEIIIAPLKSSPEINSEQNVIAVNQGPVHQVPVNQLAVDQGLPFTVQESKYEGFSQYQYTGVADPMIDNYLRPLEKPLRSEGSVQDDSFGTREQIPKSDFSNSETDKKYALL